MDLKFEGVDLEYKKAKNNLPESFWETYSYKWRENNSRDR
ncbi:degenerate transposase [Streptococcus pneumoniae]|nr:degenerate transposase [Streptococcus pneumoniae]